MQSASNPGFRGVDAVDEALIFQPIEHCRVKFLAPEISPARVIAPFEPHKCPVLRDRGVIPDRLTGQRKLIFIAVKQQRWLPSDPKRLGDIRALQAESQDQPTENQRGCTNDHQ